ncbi:MAG: ferredoxin [Acidimicrobiaceae bacterium]|nr:ferredoxin [Acidimicrobiaceae bacterium]
MKIKVDMDRCQHYGQCVFEAPQTFRFNDEDRLEYTAAFDERDLDSVQAAADVCPMQAITLAHDDAG